jgi:alpha-galactosidase
MPKHSSCFVLLVLLLIASSSRADQIFLSDLGMDVLKEQGVSPIPDLSIGGHPLSIGKQIFQHGIAAHGSNLWWIELNGSATRFIASIGLDDETKPQAHSESIGAIFKVVGDHSVLFRSGRMRIGESPKHIDVDLTGVKTLIIMAGPEGWPWELAHLDFAEATIQYTGEKPKLGRPPAETAEILTPEPSSMPQINGAKVFGVRPGHPVLFKVAATGDRPMTFAATDLPPGLSLDPATGQITGTVDQPTSATVHLTATNAKGSAHRDLRIEVGDTIALTPPMGWNSWNCFASAVSDEKVRAAADAMVNSGLIEHGWTYINIDDCWEVRASQPAENRRWPDGRIKTNDKFPDMKALADYIHSKGLRAGLYSAPGPSTCGGFTASYEFEEQDAKQYADWGFDYLKYDWCSYGGIADKIRKAPTRPTELEIQQHPYAVMHEALAKQNRDIIFSFCQYGNASVWQWGAKIGGNSWRTTGDISDYWLSMSGIGFSQSGHEKYAGPGHWNDPDMLVVGKVGWGPSLHPTHLTPNEQYTHITLWSLLASPLLIGCDMTQLDDFTRNLLTNDEVIAVNQDPLGYQASRVFIDAEHETEIWSKDLEDGTKAVGLFNRGEMANTLTAKWSDLKLQGKQPIRDLWRQKDIGDSDDHFSIEVPRHGAVLIKIGQPK